MDKDRIYQGGARPTESSDAYENKMSGGALESVFSPANLLRMLLRGWLFIVLMVGVGVLGGMLYLLWATPIFKAQAELEMSVRRPRVINNDAVFEDISWVRDTDVIYNTRFAKFRSPAMEELATHEYFKRYPSVNSAGSGASVGKYTLAFYIREVQWAKDSKANIVRVSFLNSDPEFAVRLVNVLSYCAGELMMQENQAISEEAVKWLVDQVDDQRTVLEELEKQLVTIRKELETDSLQQRNEALAQALITVMAEKEQLISTLTARETVFDFVMELKDADPNLEMLPTGLPKEERLNELIQTWRVDDEELQLATERYTQRHPEYRRVAEKEKRTRKRLEQFVELSARSVQNEIELLSKQITNVDERIEAMKSESLDLGQRLSSGLQYLQRVERKRDAADNAYQAMLRRMEEARLSADENMAYTKVIRTASVPRVPVSPERMKSLVVAVFAGGFGGCLLVVLLALVRDRVALVSDLKGLGINVIGIIPTQKKMGSRYELATIGLRDSFSHVVEVFARINALISSRKYQDRSRVILVSSLLPGEGKTVCACNLAISSALNGTRTLLIDGDLRCPQLVNIFAISDHHPSLLEWLSVRERKLEHHELVSSNVIENLDVITSRTLKEINPAELLGRTRLKDLLDWARENYDRVIIDTPPLGPVGDGQVLANQVDSVVIVSRLGKTRRRALRFVLRRFNDAGVPVLGCIANDVGHSLAGMFDGGEGYGSSYGYGGYKSYGRD